MQLQEFRRCAGYTPCFARIVGKAKLSRVVTRSQQTELGDAAPMDAGDVLDGAFYVVAVFVLSEHPIVEAEKTRSIMLARKL